MGRLLDALRTGFDFVLIDTGPGLAMADVLLLAPRVDGFVVVADAAAHRGTTFPTFGHVSSRPAAGSSVGS